MVYCKTGRPEIANDVMGVHQTDVWTLLKPQDEWRPGLTRDALIEEMDKALTENVPGVKFGFSQPIEMRVNELVAGVKSDVAALLYGPDLDVLRQKATEIERVLAHDPRRPGHQDADLGPAADAPRLGPPRPARPVRDQGGRRPRGGRRAGRDDRRHRLRRAGPARRSRSACPKSWRNDPEKIKVDPGRRPPGPSDRASRPGRRSSSRKARARSSARTSSAGRSSA